MATHRVVALLAPPVSLFELSCVVEVFGLKREEISGDWYELELATTHVGSLGLSATSMQLTNISGPDAFATADTLIVPAYPIGVPAALADMQVVRDAFERGARILTICTGSFLLAEAGIMEGKQATTHWRYVDQFRAQFPDVMLDPNILYSADGQIITSAGSAAGLDMLMHVIRSDHDAETSNLVARRLNIAPHRDGGQMQFVPRPVPTIADNRINRLVQWMRDNCRDQITIEDLASRVAMSPRNFYRHFRAVTGHTPYDWLLRERVGIAMDLLEKEHLTLDQVADAAGFTSADTLRLQFQRIVGVPPANYRRMFSIRRAHETSGAEGIRRVA